MSSKEEDSYEIYRTRFSDVDIDVSLSSETSPVLPTRKKQKISVSPSKSRDVNPLKESDDSTQTSLKSYNIENCTAHGQELSEENVEGATCSKISNMDNIISFIPITSPKDPSSTEREPDGSKQHVGDTKSVPIFSAVNLGEVDKKRGRGQALSSEEKHRQASQSGNVEKQAGFSFSNGNATVLGFAHSIEAGENIVKSMPHSELNNEPSVLTNTVGNKSSINSSNDGTLPLYPNTRMLHLVGDEMQGDWTGARNVEEGSEMTDSLQPHPSFLSLPPNQSVDANDTGDKCQHQKSKDLKTSSYEQTSSEGVDLADSVPESVKILWEETVSMFGADLVKKQWNEPIFGILKVTHDLKTLSISLSIQKDHEIVWKLEVTSLVKLLPLAIENAFSYWHIQDYSEKGIVKLRCLAFRFQVCDHALNFKQILTAVQKNTFDEKIQHSDSKPRDNSSFLPTSSANENNYNSQKHSSSSQQPETVTEKILCVDFQEKQPQNESNVSENAPHQATSLNYGASENPSTSSSYQTDPPSSLPIAKETSFQSSTNHVPVGPNEETCVINQSLDPLPTCDQVNNTKQNEAATSLNSRPTLPSFSDPVNGECGEPDGTENQALRSAIFVSLAKKLSHSSNSNPPLFHFGAKTCDVISTNLPGHQGDFRSFQLSATVVTKPRLVKSISNPNLSSTDLFEPTPTSSSELSSISSTHPGSKNTSTVKEQCPIDPQVTCNPNATGGSDLSQETSRKSGDESQNQKGASFLSGSHGTNVPATNIPGGRDVNTVETTSNVSMVSPPSQSVSTPMAMSFNFGSASKDNQSYPKLWGWGALTSQLEQSSVFTFQPTCNLPAANKRKERSSKTTFSSFGTSPRLNSTSPTSVESRRRLTGMSRKFSDSPFKFSPVFKTTAATATSGVKFFSSPSGVNFVTTQSDPSKDPAVFGSNASLNATRSQFVRDRPFFPSVSFNSIETVGVSKNSLFTSTDVTRIKTESSEVQSSSCDRSVAAGSNPDTASLPSSSEDIQPHIPTLSPSGTNDSTSTSTTKPAEFFGVPTSSLRRSSPAFGSKPDSSQSAGHFFFPGSSVANSANSETSDFKFSLDFDSKSSNPFGKCQQECGESIFGGTSWESSAKKYEVPIANFNFSLDSRKDLPKPKSPIRGTPRRCRLRQNLFPKCSAPNQKDVDAKFESSILQSLECPVCLEPCTPPIYSCSQGHHVCGKCRDKIRSCGVCKASLSHTRNWLAEEISAKVVRVACKNEQLGCSERLLSSELVAHVRSCAWSVECVCAECAWRGSIVELGAHVGEDHASLVRRGSSGERPLERGKTAQTFVELDQVRFDCQLEYSATGRGWFPYCRILGPRDARQNFLCKFVFVLKPRVVHGATLEPEHFRMVYSRQVLGFEDDFRKFNPLFLNAEMFEKFLSEGWSVVFSTKVIPREELRS